MTHPPVPLSPEVVGHHAGLHGDLNEVTCPCGDTLGFVCDVCATFVFFSVRPGTWCEHAAELWEARG